MEKTITITILIALAVATGIFFYVGGVNMPSSYVSYELKCLDVGGVYGKEITKTGDKHEMIGTCLMSGSTLYRGEAIKEIGKQEIK